MEDWDRDRRRIGTGDGTGWGQDQTFWHAARATDAYATSFPFTQEFPCTGELHCQRCLTEKQAWQMPTTYLFLAQHSTAFDYRSGL